MPQMGIGAPKSAASLSPKRPEQSRTSGSMERGTPRMRSRSSSHSPLWMSKSSVRAALVASVACTLPPVSRHRRKLSTVPKASSPRSARARAPGTLSRIQAILVPEK